MTNSGSLDSKTQVLDHRRDGTVDFAVDCDPDTLEKTPRTKDSGFPDSRIFRFTISCQIPPLLPRSSPGLLVVLHPDGDRSSETTVATAPNIVYFTTLSGEHPSATGAVHPRVSPTVTITFTPGPLRPTTRRPGRPPSDAPD